MDEWMTEQWSTEHRRPEATTVGQPTARTGAGVVNGNGSSLRDDIDECSDLIIFITFLLLFFFDDNSIL